MKRLFVLLLAGSALLNISCKEEVGIDGTIFSYDDTFVWEDGELVLAHEYVLNFPAQGGSLDLKIVSSGMLYGGPGASSDQFAVELLDKIDDDPESNIYDYVDAKMIGGGIERLPRYLQTLRITAERNKRSGSRSAKLDIQTNSLSGREAARAIVTLRQAGAK